MEIAMEGLLCVDSVEFCNSLNAVGLVFLLSKGENLMRRRESQPANLSSWEISSVLNLIKCLIKTIRISC